MTPEKDGRTWNLVPPIKWTRAQWKAVAAFAHLTSNKHPRASCTIYHASVRDVADAAGMSMQTARAALNKLAALGVLKRSGIASCRYRVVLR